MSLTGDNEDETSADDVDSSDFPKLGISMRGILLFIGMMYPNIVILF